MPTTRHDALLRRGRRTWNLMSGYHGGVGDRIGAPLYDLAIRHLDLRAGEAVLDIGCGTGSALGRLREAVGPDGRVVGVDYSPRMLSRAHRRVRDQAWTNVELRRADASREPHGDGEFDAALALTSISAMPDIAEAVRLAHDALRPGGRLFVFDMRLVPEGSAWTKATIGLGRLCYRATTGFTGADVLAELRRTFATIEPVVPGGDTSPTMTLTLATK
ncbi:MAG TPA: methyltransferase domain-containing protein [Pseudonocardiaceae bacterium]|nr:methyltransferase domain-containing protein [Pseudonocardiaceae bacterium]